MTQSEIQQLVTRLGFSPNALSNTYTKTYKQHKNYTLELDFTNRRIRYAEPIKVSDETTSHFTAPENFVVLECVNRLLEKGYEPQHIELERRWSLGRTGKSGKADITVVDREGQSLIVIECKTFGSEYEKEKRNTTSGGGQLFSYLQQDRNTRFLCLYASELKQDKVRYENAIVQIKDRPEVTELVKNDPDTVAYETAKTKEELHRAWKENFNTYFAPNGIFDEEAQAYNPEFKPIKRKDLKPFTDQEGRQLFNAFEEILRHNNISDRSNAFNRILSLILCKIVDERKQPNEETGFQVKEATDTPEAIQERLQRLYQQGMQEYLKEEFTYISEDEVDEIVSRFPRQTAQQQIKEIVRKLKFYSNNEFAFKEVHNESLFNENAKVLNEILALLQYKQFRYQRADAQEYKHQKSYLGDFFELLLDAGYKQTAGQFFTPLPIARFIVKSLPVGQIIGRKLHEQRTQFLPYVIDYACGSGHFLTEVMEEIQNHIDQLPPTYSDDVNQNLEHWKKADWTGEFIYGIEKDYRLARTAKVACFMNGDGEANIIFGDGLEEYTRPVKGRNYKFPQQGFDLIVANPPYSIQSFKTHLGLKNSDFTLFDHLTETASEIEVLFIERTAQLLREGGIAGVVLPSSILSNTGIYSRARELLLRQFEVKAIVEFGSNTFMATGTNTVTLFLARRNDRLADDFRAVADDFILNNKARPDDFADTEALLTHYTERLGLYVPDYRSLLTQTPTDALKQSDVWRDYKRWFDDLTEVKNLRTKNKAFALLNPHEQQAELDRLFYQRVLAREHDKFWYFCLTYGQPTLLVRLPTDGADEKKFLGYEFSRRRGDEGIKKYTDAQGRHQTSLYDEENLHNPNKLNTLVWQVLSHQTPTIPDALRTCANLVDLSDCLDFTRVDFEKQIGLSTQTTNSALYWSFVKDAIPLKTLQEIKILLKRGKSPSYGTSDVQIIKSGQARGYRTFDFTQKHYIADAATLDDRQLQKGDILINSTGVGTAGRVTLFDLDGAFTADSHITILRLDVAQALPTYVLYALAHIGFKNLEAMANGSSGQIELPLSTIERIKVPLPPLDVQQQIVADIEALEQQETADSQLIQDSRAEIEQLVNAMQGTPTPIREVAEVNPSKEVRQLTPDSLVSFVEMASISNEGGITDKEDRPLISVQKGYTCFRDGDVLFAKITPCMENGKGAIANSLTNGIGFGSTEFFVLRPNGKLKGELLYRFLQRRAYRAEAEKSMTGASGHRRVPKAYIENTTINVPTVHEQETIVNQIQDLEARIREAEARLSNVPEQKAGVLKRYLQ